MKDPGSLTRGVSLRASLSLLLLMGSIGSACGGSLPLDRSSSLGPPAEKGDVEDVPVRGYPIQVELRGGCNKSGELMAVDREYIWLLEGPDGGSARAGRFPERLIALRFEEATRVSVEVYPSDSAAVAAWTALGTASTLSHGGFLILSAPVWLATGISASVSEARSNDAEGKPKDLKKLFHFARFPQGMPGHLRARGRTSGC